MKYIGGALCIVGAAILIAGALVAVLAGSVAYIDLVRDLADRHGLAVGVIALLLPGVSMLGLGVLFMSRSSDGVDA